jgi:hypothetical protein
MELKNEKSLEYDKGNFRAFNEFILKETKRLEPNYHVGTIENLLCKAFSNDSISFGRSIIKPNFNGTKIKGLYDNELFQARRIVDIDWNVYTGIWKPFGAAQVLGNHPIFGAQCGWIKRSITYNFNFEFRFLDAAHHYYAYDKFNTGVWDSTKVFTGINLCFEVSRPIFESEKMAIEIIGGAGYDGFETFHYNNSNYNNYNNRPRTPTAGFLSCNGGIGIKHKLKDNNFLGFQLKYNIVDYTANNIVNFTGNSISLRVMYGGTSGFKNRKMKLLQANSVNG